jgi:polysaccharide biosynthesis transport protein
MTTIPDVIPHDAHTALTNSHVALDQYLGREWQEGSDAGRRPVSTVQLWNLLYGRRWLILGCIAGLTFAVTLLCLLLTRRYDASARIMLELQNSDALGLEQMMTPLSLDMNTRLETQIRVLQSKTIAAEVIRQLELQRNQGFAGKRVASSTLDEMNLAQRAQLLKIFERSLKVSLLPKTQIIEIRFRSADPKLAADVANALAAIFIEHNFQTKYRATVQTSNWLTQQLDDLRKRAEAAQDTLITYQRKTGILGTDETHNIITAKLDELNKQLSTAEADRIVKEARFRIASTGNPELIASLVPESVLGSLYKRRSEGRAQFAQLSAKFGPAYPRVAQLESQLREVDTDIAEQMEKLVAQSRAEYQASTAAEKMMAASLEKQKQEAYKLNENAVQYAILRRDVESSRELYEGLLRKLKEAGILASLKSSNIHIVDPASTPVDPATPNVPLNIGLGLVGGLLFGVAAAFVLENANTSIRTPEDVEIHCGLPSLGIVPKIQYQGQAKRRQLANGETRLPITVAHPNSGGAEAFRALRTSLLLSSPLVPPHVIVVTSALAGDGKSFTALNLAIVLAQANQKVLLIDADLRRPTIHTLLGIPMAPGLSACLAGTQEPGAVVTEFKRVPGLHVVPSGYSPPYPSEMLASEGMRQSVEHWRAGFRYIVLDTPPALAVTDAVICATLADAVILVARSEKTGRQSLSRASELLHRVRARIVGAVINDLALNSTGYHAYYGHYAGQHDSYYCHDEES